MMENIYYITGAIFFSLSIIILAVVLVYCIKIMRRIVAIENEMKKTVGEFKIKVAAFSIGITSIVALLEKLIQIKNKMAAAGDEAENAEPRKKKKQKNRDDDL